MEHTQSNARPICDRGDVVVAGLGNLHRHDDAAGLIVAEAVERTATGEVVNIGPIEDPLDLLGVWDGARLALVVDAVRTGAPPGTVHHLELQADAADRATLPERPQVSTHGIGLAGVLRLAVATGTAPSRVTAVGIEGENFERGQGLTHAVQAAIPVAVGTILELLQEAASCA
jgi:hydrogenase maturation protease